MLSIFHRVIKCRYLLFITLMMGCFSASSQNYIVGTYNLRYDNPADSGNLWANRSSVIAQLIRFHDFDILGTQEGLFHMLKDLSKDLPEYKRYGIGRVDGKDAGEHSEIFFKKKEFKKLRSGDFWLSETPDSPSLGWDATCCNRICSWVQLRDKKTGKKLYVFNTHYDFQMDSARNESSKLMLRKIKKIAGKTPVIFMGDLNGDNTTEWYKRIAKSRKLKDTYKLAKRPYALNPTWQGFGNRIEYTDKIDHIFVSKSFKVRRWGILSDTYHGKYPSDHFPILTEVTFK